MMMMPVATRIMVTAMTGGRETEREKCADEFMNDRCENDDFRVMLIRSRFALTCFLSFYISLRYLMWI